MAKKVIFGLLVSGISLFTAPVFSQGLTTVSGKVIDNVTRKPIPNAHVYVNNTTRGTISDSLGRFNLRLVRSENVDLVVSVVGYHTLRTLLNLAGKPQTLFEFRMIPEVRALAEVEVKASRIQGSKEWKLNYELFRSAMLGTSSNAENSEIVNPEVISFERIVDPVHNVKLKATTSATLEITNQSLGYNVFVTLEKFEFSPTYYAIRASNRFEELTPRNSKEFERWRINRLRTYTGSQMHLFRSIRQGRYSEEGFRISRGKSISQVNAITSYENPAFEKNDSLRYTDIIVDSASNHFRVFQKGVYQVVFVNKFVGKEFRTLRDYPLPVSWIVVKDSTLALDALGEPMHIENLGFIGYFDKLRIADMLPTDYTPEFEDRNTIDATETGIVQGTVTDESGTPLEGVTIFIHQGLLETTTNVWGQYQLKNLAPGIYDIGFFDEGMTPTTRSVTVALGQEAKLNVALTEHTHDGLIPNGKQDVLLATFERKLLDKTTIRLGEWRISNPHVLQFRINKNKDIDIHNAAPVTVESSNLGYAWTFYINSARLKKRKGDYDLEISSAIKVNRLSSDKKIRNLRWKMNQYDQYVGSLNHFIVALTEGRIQDEGFKVFQNTTDESGKRKAHIKKVMPQLKELVPDSLLVVTDGLLYLRVPKGLEIHSAQNQNRSRYYKHYRPYVYRIKSEGGPVAVSPDGHIAQSISLGNTSGKYLPMLPVDYKSPYEIPSDKSVLFLLKKDDLVLVKGMQEKTYVQTDRPYYYPGDTIWFKAYLTYYDQHLKDSLSKVLYVDLMHGPDTIVSNRVLRIDKGMTWGDMGVAYNLPPGDYFLRAYTQWMRNFNECFWLHIPILSREYDLAPSIKQAESVSNAITTKLTFDKTKYGPREEVKVTIRISDAGSPITKSSLAVSVTDMSAVQELENAPTIYSLTNSFKADRATMMRIKYPIEKLITIRGRLINPQKNNEVFAYLKGDPKPILAKLKGDDFQLSFDFYDTTSVLIKAINDAGILPSIELVPEGSTETYTAPVMLNYTRVKKESGARISTWQGTKTQLLNEVVVKAKRISIPAVPITQTQRRFGNPTQLYNNITSPAFLHATRKTDNLLTSLLTAVPDFGPTAQLIRNSNQVMHQSNGEVIAPGGVIGYFQKLYTLMLDGVKLEYNQVMNTSASNISQIEIYKNGLIDLISIYTENFVPIPPNFYRYQIRGFDRPSTFKEPNLTSAVPDYRSTLYWNPAIETSEEGIAQFVFHTSDVTENYRIVLEGVTEDGRIFRHVEVLPID